MSLVSSRSLQEEAGVPIVLSPEVDVEEEWMNGTIFPEGEDDGKRNCQILISMRTLTLIVLQA